MNLSTRPGVGVTSKGADGAGLAGAVATGDACGAAGAGEAAGPGAGVEVESAIAGPV